MRTDTKLSLKDVDLKPIGFSYNEMQMDRSLYRTGLSGKERNKLFYHTDLKTGFADMSGISGLDDLADGRVFAVTDFNRDQFPDFVLINANNPSVQIFRNNTATCSGDACVKPNAIALRFVGGNHRAAPSSTWSNRDGFGVYVTVDLGDSKLVRESRAGEGFASQNSTTMLIGIGKHTSTQGITVRWPSGVVQELPEIPSGKLVTVYENPNDSPNGELLTLAAY